MNERTAEQLLYLDATLAEMTQLAARGRPANRIAHNDWTVDDDIVWLVVSEHATQLHQVLAAEIDAARSALKIGDDLA